MSDDNQEVQFESLDAMEAAGAELAAKGPPVQDPEPQVQAVEEPSESAPPRIEEPKAAKAQKNGKAPPVVEKEPAQASVYQPMQKISVMDKEYDVPAYLQKVLNAENETEVKDLLSKAYGLEPVKAHRDELKDRLTQIDTEVMPHYELLQQGVNDVIDARDKGDLDTVFEKIGLSDDQIAQYIIEKARLKQMPENEQKVYEQRRINERRAQELERENSGLKTQVQQAEVRQGQIQLENALVSPAVKQFADQWDGVFGAGSFKQEVISFGIQQEVVAKQKPTVAQAVEATLARAQKFLSAIPQAAGQLPGSQTQNTQQNLSGSHAPAAKATLPNIGQGANTSTVQREIRSLKDMEEVYDQMVGNTYR